MTPDLHLFPTEGRWHALVVDGSRIYDLDAAAAEALRDAVDTQALAALLSTLGLRSARPSIDLAPIAPPRVHGISLAVSSTCNLACTYCYAQQGGFGRSPQPMSWAVAKRAIDGLLGAARPGDFVKLTFLGGEPLVNRSLVRRATVYTEERGAALGVTPHFSITTNGTLVEDSDAEFFGAHRFAVTISLDGAGPAHDRQRPLRGGGGSYERVLQRITPLLQRPGRMHVSARVTVTPRSADLRATLDHFVALGFDSVGFAPVLAAPGGGDELAATDFDTLLVDMTACGREFERRIRVGERYGFANMESAMEQLHRGTHRPYPCGAGAGYLGVSGDGGLFACHRFVDDPRAAMGSVADGPDDHRRRIWLTERHVDRQNPCSTCWARYLCGGGCHHEVINRGRPACDYIRGWLHYCLQAYVRLLDERPDYFDPPPRPSAAPA